MRYLIANDDRMNLPAACFAANRVGPHENNNAFFARIGQALLVNLPLLFWAYLVGNEGGNTGAKMLALVVYGI
jgi:hypothetical protein